MKTLRIWLGFPVFLLAALAGGISFGLRWTGQRLMRVLAGGTVTHVYWPLVQLHRIVLGAPRWQPQDLMIGQQPRTDADRKLADDHPDIVKMLCGCDNPSCRMRTTPHYSWSPGSKEGMQRRAAAIERAQISMDDMPPEIKATALEAMRKMVGFDEVKDERDKLSQLVALQQQELLTLRQLVDSDKLVIDSDRKVIEADERLINEQRAVIAELEVHLAARDAQLAELSQKFTDLEARVRDFRRAHAPLN